MRLRAEPVCSAHKMARLPHANPMTTGVSITQTQRDKCANTWGRTCALQSIHRTDQWYVVTKVQTKCLIKRAECNRQRANHVHSQMFVQTYQSNAQTQSANEMLNQSANKMSHQTCKPKAKSMRSIERPIKRTIKVQAKCSIKRANQI